MKRDVIVPDGSNLISIAQNNQPPPVEQPVAPKWQRWVNEEGEFDPPPPGERPMGMSVNVEGLIDDVIRSNAFEQVVKQAVARIMAEEKNYIEGQARNWKMDPEDREAFVATRLYEIDHRDVLVDEVVANAMKAVTDSIANDLG